MRINSWNVSAAESGPTGKPERAVRTGRASAPPESRAVGDKAHLTWDGARVEALEAEVHKMSDVRRERVDALREAVADGRYDVASEQVATAIVEEMAARGSALR